MADNSTNTSSSLAGPANPASIAMRNAPAPSRSTRVWDSGVMHLRGLSSNSSSRISANTATYMDHFHGTIDQYRRLQPSSNRAQDSTRNSPPEPIRSYNLYCSTCHPSSSNESKKSFLPSRTCYPEHLSVSRRPSSNGTLLHTRAIQHSDKGRRFWKSKPRGIQKAVVPLDEEYFTHAHVFHCGDDPKIHVRRPCGCTREGIGCANCGSPLGTKTTYCTAATEHSHAAGLSQRLSFEERISAARLQTSMRNVEGGTHFSHVLSASEGEILTLANQSVFDDMYPQSMCMSSSSSRSSTTSDECFTFFPDAVVPIAAALLSLPPIGVTPFASGRRFVGRSSVRAIDDEDLEVVNPRALQGDSEPPPSFPLPSIPRSSPRVSTSSSRAPMTASDAAQLVSWAQARESVAQQLADLDPLSPELNNPIDDMPPLQEFSDSDSENENIRYQDWVDSEDEDDVDLWLSSRVRDRNGNLPRPRSRTMDLPLPPRSNSMPVPQGLPSVALSDTFRSLASATPNAAQQQQPLRGLVGNQSVFARNLMTIERHVADSQRRRINEITNRTTALSSYGQFQRWLHLPYTSGQEPRREANSNGSPLSNEDISALFDSTERDLLPSLREGNSATASYNDEPPRTYDGAETETDGELGDGWE